MLILRQPEMACAGATRTRFLAVLVLSVLVSSIQCYGQKPGDQIDVDLDVPHTAVLEKGQFGFHIGYTWRKGQQTLQVEVKCTTGMKCEEKAHKVSENHYDGDWTATLTRDLNLAEIQASLLTASGETLGTSTKGIDLGFKARKAELKTSLPDSITAGDEQRLRLWFADKNNTKVVPTATVHIDLVADNRCADFRYVPSSPAIATRSTYGERGAASILADHEQPDGDLFIQPHTWFTSMCRLDVYETVAGTTEIGHDPITFRVEPAVLPALVVCFAGVFAQFLASGILRIIAIAKERPRVDVNNNSNPENRAAVASGTRWKILKDVFVGDQGSEILSFILKGCLAYGACWLTTSTDRLGIKVDRTTLVGFFTLGFMVGFWPVEKLWSLLAPRSSE